MVQEAEPTSGVSTTKVISRRNRTRVVAKKKDDINEAKLKKNIAVHFGKAQKSKAIHAKCCERLSAIRKKLPKAMFLEEFVKNIYPILLVFKREPAVERLVQFLAEFVKQETTADSQSVDFVCEVISKLLPLSNAEDKAVRFRVCQICANLIYSLPEEVEIDEDLLEAIIEKLSFRLRDKVPLIRMHAVHALRGIQTEGSIADEFVRALANDSSKDVRKAILSVIHVTKQNQDAVIERTKDVKEDVRMTAFTKLADVGFKKLSIANRVTILRNGLEDTSLEVQTACRKLLFEQWLPSLEMNPIKLLEGLDVEAFTEVCHRTMKVIFEQCHKQDNKITDAPYVEIKEASTITHLNVDVQNLTAESSFFLKCKCEYLRNTKQEDTIDDILPSLSEFCGIAFQYFKDKKEFITDQLLEVAKYLDYSDEAGRNNMILLLNNIVSTFYHAETHVKQVVAAMKVAVPLRSQYTKMLLDHVQKFQKTALETSEEAVKLKEDAEIREEQIEGQIKKIEKMLKQLKTQKQKFIDKDQYDEAKEVAQKIKLFETEMEQLKLDLEEQHHIQEEEVMLWMRAALVMAELMENLTKEDISKCVPVITSLQSHILTHENTHIRQTAYKLVGQTCCYDIEYAKQNLMVLVKSVERETEEHSIQMSSFRSIFDIILVHGADKLFPAENAEETSTKQNQLIAALRNGFNHDDIEVRAVATEGFAKLIICKKLHPQHISEILCKQILLLFSPDTENEPRTRQCLSLFLPAYAFSLPSNQEIISSNIIPILRKVAQSPKESSLHKISLLQIANFLLNLTNASSLHKEEHQKQAESLAIHEKLGLALAFEILSAPKAKESNTYCKLLNNLNLYDSNLLYAKKLKYLAEKIQEKLSNKLSIKAIERFIKSLTSMLKNDEVELTSEQIKELEEQQEAHDADRATTVASDSDEDLKLRAKTPKKGAKRTTSTKSKTTVRKTKTSRRKKEETSDEESETSEDDMEDWMHDEEEEEESSDEEEEEEKPKKRAPRVSKPKKKNTKVYEDSEEEEEEEEKPKPAAKKTQSKAKPTNKPVAKPSIVVEEEKENYSNNLARALFDSEEDEEQVSKQKSKKASPPPAKQAPRVAEKKKQVISDDDDDMQIDLGVLSDDDGNATNSPRKPLEALDEEIDEILEDLNV